MKRRKSKASKAAAREPTVAPAPVIPPTFAVAYWQWVNIQADIEKFNLKGSGSDTDWEGLAAKVAAATWAMIRHRAENIREIRGKNGDVRTQRLEKSGKDYGGDKAPPCMSAQSAADLLNVNRATVVSAKTVLRDGTAEESVLARQC